MIPFLMGSCTALIVLLFIIERKTIMSLATLQASVATNNQLVTQLISIVQAAPTSTGVSEADLAAVQDSVDATNAQLQAVIAAKTTA